MEKRKCKGRVSNWTTTVSDESSNPGSNGLHIAVHENPGTPALILYIKVSLYLNVLGTFLWGAETYVMII